MDSLRLGMGWSCDDLSKPHILINSTSGQTHPGSIHLDGLVEQAYIGIFEAGARAIKTCISDVCDGIAQGHWGMRYSLAFREVMAQLVEIQAQSQQADGLILISSCDKSIPAHLISAARLDIPAILIPGGSMDTGAAGLYQGDIPAKFFQLKKGEISASEFQRLSEDAAPTC